MKGTIIIGLVNNTAILVAFAMLYENFWLKFEASKRLWANIITGVILGAIGIILMLNTWVLIPGIVFDTRSIILCISGLFFGPIPTIIAMLTTVTLRLIMGGDGMWMGTAVIISSGTIGLLWRYFRPFWQQKNIYVELIVMGMIVHLVMIGCAFLLPANAILTTIKSIALPLILIYSPATMLLGVLLVKQSTNLQNRLAEEKLHDSERRLSQIINKQAFYELNINEERIHTNDELIKTRGKAEESDRLKSAFLANMSHEIRTPMNGILGFAELLKEPALTGEKQQEYIRIIEKGGVRMLNIINNLIDISKIESGQSEILVSAFNVNEQIEYVYNLFKPDVEQKGLQIIFHSRLPEKVAIIQTDCEKICAILMHLIKNAIKYTEKGDIEIGYQLNNKFLHFFVKDAGIGIHKDRHEAIFERFVQADISDHSALQGAGLGLAISKAYVNLLGGEIWVESEEGKGSTFHFTIPYNCDTEPDEMMTIENVFARDEEDKGININYIAEKVKDIIAVIDNRQVA